MNYEWIDKFKELLKKCWFTVPLLGFISSLILYFSRETSIPSIFIITLTAWLASDVVVVLFIRGGSGILQIPLFGNKAQPKGYGFLFFFITIFTVSIGINVLTDKIAFFLSNYLSDFLVDLGIGFFLSALVFLDLNAKFYTRE